MEKLVNRNSRVVQREQFCSFSGDLRCQVLREAFHEGDSSELAGTIELLQLQSE